MCAAGAAPVNLPRGRGPRALLWYGKMNMRRSIAIFLLTALLLVACGGAATPGPTVVAEPVDTEPSTQPEPTQRAAEAAPTDTAVPPTATADGVPPTATAVPPTPTVFPTATAVPAALLTPAPHAPDVEQPAYAESECSDRFPCNDNVAAWESRIQVPPGFAVEYFAYLPHPFELERPSQITSMTFGPDDLLYAATWEGVIYTIDAEGRSSVFIDGFTVPTGIAFQPGTERLFVSDRISDRNVGGEGRVSVVENGQTTTLIDGIPCCYIGMHAPNGIAFGPDGYGYVGVGGRADHGEVLDGTNSQDEMHAWEASILRFSPDSGAVDVYARGFRNPYDIAWDAKGRLWAGDNGRDGNAADGDIVPDELHIVQPGGEHGYPHYECPVCFGIPDGVEVIEPTYAFEPHSVPVGMETYLAEQFPGYYNSVFVTLWTALPFAERVMRFTADGTGSTFATGFAAPMEVTTGPDGSLYVADYATGIIFRISYVGE